MFLLENQRCALFTNKALNDPSIPYERPYKWRKEKPIFGFKGLSFL